MGARAVFPGGYPSAARERRSAGGALTPCSPNHYYSPLMSKALPEHIQPLRLAERGATLEGAVPVAPMARLAEMLVQTESEAVFALRFERDQGGRSRVLGQVRARLVAVCQRCLAPVSLDIEREVRLGIVRDDAEAAALDSDYDPLVVGEEPLALMGLLEDELILAMPNFARHRPGECAMPAGADAVAGEDTENGAEDAREGRRAGEDSPFSVLESLKSRKSP